MVQFSVTNHRLACDVAELIASLGYRCQTATKRVRGRLESSSVEYIVTFSTDDEVFALRRKAAAHKERRAVTSTARCGSRFIVGVRSIGSVPVRCVEVDNTSHMYLASKAMLPTHNSTLALDFLRSCSIKHGMASVIFSLEMSKSEIVMRLLSAEAKIKLADMRSGRLSDDDWTRMARRMAEISAAPLYIDDSPNLTMMEIRAKARRLKQKTDLRLVVVDYLQLISIRQASRIPPGRGRGILPQPEAVGRASHLPVIAISQLNRGPEQRTDKMPQLSDLRETGQLEQDADLVILINRPDAYERDSPRAGEADLILAKHRNGPIKTCTVASRLHLSCFSDLRKRVAHHNCCWTMML